MTPLSKDELTIEAQAAIEAWATVRLPFSDINALRMQPAPAGGKALPPRFLKNADEQTVAGVVAVLRAMDANGWNERSFVDWAVLGAPQFLGRLTVAGIINRFLSEPAYSMSPHVIPNQCLHSLSGTISVGFGIRGPNYGVGGGRNDLGEKVLAALTLLRGGKVPGVWLVLTAGDPEPIPDFAGKPVNEFDLLAVALALTAAPGNAARIQLTLGFNTELTASPALADLVEFLGRNHSGGTFRCPVPGLGKVELQLP